MKIFIPTVFELSFEWIKVSKKLQPVCWVTVAIEGRYTIIHCKNNNSRLKWWDKPKNENKRNKTYISETHTHESSINTIKNNIEANSYGTTRTNFIYKKWFGNFFEYGKWCGGGHMWRQLTPKSWSLKGKGILTHCGSTVSDVYFGLISSIMMVNRWVEYKLLSHRQTNLTNHVAPFELDNIHYLPQIISTGGIISNIPLWRHTRIILHINVSWNNSNNEHQTYDIKNNFTDSHCNLQEADGNRFDYLICFVLIIFQGNDD